MRHSRRTTRTRRSAGVAASAAATSGTLPKGSRTRISRIVADRNSAAIVEGGASSAGGAVYRRTVAAVGLRWHNCALRHGPSRSRAHPSTLHRFEGIYMRIRLFVVLSTLALVGAADAQTKQRIDKVADLPRFTYKIDGQVEDLIRNDAKFGAFAAAVRRDTESTLAKYEIADK